MRQVWKNKDVRRRTAYTMLMLIIIRIGSQMPAPGVDSGYIRQFFESQSSQSSQAWQFIDMFTGGSFTQMSLFALGITPYITASIVVQLLTIAIPALGEMHKDGEEGRKKIASITRYSTAGLALIEATAMGYGFGRQGMLRSTGAGDIFVFTVGVTAGASLLMWIGECITERGIGNGISMVLLFNIIARVPQDMVSLYEQFMSGKPAAQALFSGCVILIIILAVIIFVLMLQGGEHRVAVQYAQQTAGRASAGGRSDIPVKVNTAGVIPVIFASSVMQMPILIAQLSGKGNGTGIGSHILKAFNSGNWFNPNELIYTVGILLYMFLTVFFAYFYTSITFNPLEIAQNLKRSGGVIPGIRAGKPTVEYLQRILKYLIFIGACGLIIVQIIPFFISGVFGAQVSFGGTSLIIITGVILEVIKQIDARSLNYKWTGPISGGRGL